MKKLILVLLAFISLTSWSQSVYTDENFGSGISFSLGSNVTITDQSPISLNPSVSSECTEFLWTTSGTGIFADSSLKNTTYTPSMVDVFTDTVTLSLIATCDIGDSTFIYSSKLLLSEPSFPVENLRSFVSPIEFTTTATDTLIIMKDMANANVDTIDVNNIDFDITLGYIPLKTLATMQFISNVPDDTAFINHEVPPTVIFPNIDYTDRKFFKFEEHLLAVDSLEVHPARLTGITFYSTALTGDNKTLAYNYFDVPEFNSSAKVLDFYGGSNAADGSLATPYLTWAKAIANVSSGDTIYIKSSTSKLLSNASTKGVYVIGLGNVIKDGGTSVTAFTSAATSGYISIENIYVKSSNTGLTLTSPTVNSKVKNCYIKGNYPIYNVTGTTTKLNVDNNVLIGQERLLISTDFKENYFKSDIYGAYYGISITSKWDCYNNSYALQFIAGSKNYDAKFCKFNCPLFYSENTTPSEYLSINIDRCLLTQKLNTNIATHKLRPKDMSITIKNCEIVGFNYLSNNYININADTIKFINNTFEMGSVNAAITGIGINDSSVMIIENNTFASTGNYLIYPQNYNVIARNNIFQSDSTCTIQIRSLGYDSLDIVIDSNTFLSENGSGAFIVIGTEPFLSTDSCIKGYIRDNKMYGPGYYGNAAGSKHGVLVWNQSIDFINNYINGSFLGFVIKSNGGTYDNNIYNCVVENCSSPLTIKGVQGTEIYNNTFINAGIATFSYEDNEGASGYSGNTKYKNNIIISDIVSNYALGFENDEDTIGCEFENNIYYNYTDVTRLESLGYYNLSEWQSQGFDINSYISNPLLDATYTPATGSDAINNGADLGITTDYYGNPRVGNTDIGAVEKQ